MRVAPRPRVVNNPSPKRLLRRQARHPPVPQRGHVRRLCLWWVSWVAWGCRHHVSLNYWTCVASPMWTPFLDPDHWCWIPWQGTSLVVELRWPICWPVFMSVAWLTTPSCPPCTPWMWGNSQTSIHIIIFVFLHPLSSDRQHLRCDVRLEVRGKIIRTVLFYCVLKLCSVISTLRWAVLTVLWIGFCHTGPISLCVDLCVLLRARWGGPDGIEA